MSQRSFVKDLAHAITVSLRPALTFRPLASASAQKIIQKPIAEYMRDGWLPNKELFAMVPTLDGAFVKVSEALPEQALASIEYLRRLLADCERERPFADNVAARLTTGDVTAQEYTMAICTADALEFLSGKLVVLYAGFMHSMPIYIACILPYLSGRPSIYGGHGAVSYRWLTADPARRQQHARRCSIPASSKQRARKTWSGK